MCLCKLTVGVTSISAGSGGARPVVTLPGEAQEESRGEACQPWVKSVGAWPVMESCRLCTLLGLDHSLLARAWHVEAQPAQGHEDGEQSSSSIFLPDWGNWVGRVYCPPGCALDLPHPEFLAPWARCTPSLAVPLGMQTQVTPLHALNLPWLQKKG